MYDRFGTSIGGFRPGMRGALEEVVELLRCLVGLLVCIVGVQYQIQCGVESRLPRLELPVMGPVRLTADQEWKKRHTSSFW